MGQVSECSTLTGCGSTPYVSNWAAATRKFISATAGDWPLRTQTDTWRVRYIHTHRHTIYTDRHMTREIYTHTQTHNIHRQTHDPWHMWPQVAQTMTKLMLMFSSVLMLFTKQSTIFHDVLSHDKRYSARQLLKQLSFQALVLSITSLTTTSTSDKWFSVLATWLRSRWSLKFHISETRLYILMKLLHITLIKR